MKTLLRSTTFLLLILWIGAVLFFPVVAAVAFRVLPTMQAGLVVRGCLVLLHQEGLAAGALLLLLLIAAAVTRAYGRPMIGPLLCTTVMLLLTAFSQWNVMPRMERDRLATGGDINAMPTRDPHRLDFERLHVASVRLEGGVLAAGLVMAALLARPPRSSPPSLMRR